MSEFDVDGTKVRFDDSWWAMKWDESTAYRSGLGKALQGTKAIDLIAVRNETLYFFELTDFVAYPIETKSQLVGGKLITEVVTKVRDTLAGLVGVTRETVTEFKPVQTALAKGASPEVVCWAFLSHQKMNDELLVNELQQELKRRLKWLTRRASLALTAKELPIPGMTLKRVS